MKEGETDCVKFEYFFFYAICNNANHNLRPSFSLHLYQLGMKHIHKPTLFSSTLLRKSALNMHPHVKPSYNFVVALIYGYYIN